MVFLSDSWKIDDSSGLTSCDGKLEQKNVWSRFFNNRMA